MIKETAGAEYVEYSSEDAIEIVRIRNFVANADKIGVEIQSNITDEDESPNFASVEVRFVDKDKTEAYLCE